MRENCRGKKYFLTNLDTRRKKGSVTKIWLCKVMSEKRGWQVTKSPPLNLPLFKCSFSGPGYLCFCGRRAIHICNIYTYKQKISYSHVFLIFHFPFSSSFNFRLKKTFMFSGKKTNTIFPDFTKKIKPWCEYFRKTMFSEHLKKTSYFHVFFWERSSFPLCLKNKIIF